MFVHSNNRVYVLIFLHEKLCGSISNTSGLSSWNHREGNFGFSLCFLCLVVKKQCQFKTPQSRTQGSALMIALILIRSLETLIGPGGFEDLAAHINLSPS